MEHCGENMEVTRDENSQRGSVLVYNMRHFHEIFHLVIDHKTF